MRWSDLGVATDTLTHPVIGPLTPDLAGELFETGFQCFRAGTVHGLARVDALGTLDILAIASDEPGRGHVSAFLAACQAAYPKIHMLFVANPRLAAMLAKRGFRETTWAERGEVVEGWMWERKLYLPRPETGA